MDPVAEEIQRLADTNDTQKFYEALKAVYGLSHHKVHPVKSKDGNTVIKDHDGILSRWAEHLSELLNCVNSTDPTLVDLIPQFPVIPQLDHPPALYEIQTAVKNNKAAIFRVKSLSMVAITFAGTCTNSCIKL